MPRVAFLLALVLVACGGARAAAPTPDADPVAALIDDVRARLHVPGIAVAIVRDGAVTTYVRGEADLAWAAPVGRDTAFQIASTTKILTGTLVASLAADGTIALDAPVSRYLPDAPDAWRDTTLADLAAHASGLDELEVPRTATVEEVYAAARAAPLAYPPGTDVRYVTTDLSILQLVLERATGRRFLDLLRDRVLEPAGMTCTRFEDAAEVGPTRTAEVVPRRATVYDWTGDRQRVSWFFYPPATYASGGAFSCLDDLARWAVAIDDGRLMAGASDRAATTPHRLRDGRSAGFGAVFSVGTLHGLPTYGHSGGPALGDVVRIPDEKLTVIVLTNQKHLIPVLAPMIASLLLPPGPSVTPARDADPALTGAHRAVVAGLPEGQVDDAAFAAERRADLVPAIRDWGRVQTVLLPAMTAFTLVADETRAGSRVRTYVAEHGTRLRMRWEITLDAAGLVAGIDGRLE